MCTLRSSGNFSWECGLVEIDSQRRAQCEAVVNASDSLVLLLHRRYVYCLYKPKPCQYWISLLNFKAFYDKFQTKSQKILPSERWKPSSSITVIFHINVFSGHVNLWTLEENFKLSLSGPFDFQSDKVFWGIKYGWNIHYHSTGLLFASHCGYTVVNINVCDHKLLIALCMTFWWRK